MAVVVKDFLDRHLISPSCIDIDELCSFKISEMEAGLAGRPSSLAMLNSYCTPATELVLNKKVGVIDAGGTNLRTCTVYFNEKKEPVFEDYKTTSMPGIKEEVSSQKFFEVLADQVERFAGIVDTFGFCFSYAAEILPDHDGVPVLLSKEIKAPQVVGKHLGKELFAELSRRGHNMSDCKIIVMNDTVTTLLAGLSEVERLGCEGCVGFILGTGTNTAFISTDGIINEESANLKVPLGDLDQSFVNNTLDPESHLLEKLVGGAYLGQLGLYIIRAAAKEGLFSEEFVSSLKSITSLSTLEMCSFLESVDSPLEHCVQTENDRLTLQTIIETHIERSAKLAAANLAACVLKTESKGAPVLINADGTTFYNTPDLKKKTEEYLVSYLKEKGRKAIFTNIRRSPMIGSAIGALSI